MKSLNHLTQYIGQLSKISIGAGVASPVIKGVRQPFLSALLKNNLILLALLKDKNKFKVHFGALSHYDLSIEKNIDDEWVCHP